MDATRWERIAVATGFVAVALFIAGFFLPGAPLLANASAAKVHSYYAAKRSSLLIGFILIWIGAAFLLWFLGALRSYLRRYEGGDGRLSATAYGGGLIAIAMVFVGTVIPAAIAYNIVASGALAAMKAFFDLSSVAAVLTGPPAGVLFVAVALVTIRHRALPVWTAWVGFLAALFNILSIFTIFRTTGLFSPTGPVGLLAFGSVLIWTVCVGVTMLRRLGQPAPA